jgi:hypothetical protein
MPPCEGSPFGPREPSGHASAHRVIGTIKIAAQYWDRLPPRAELSNTIRPARRFGAAEMTDSRTFGRSLQYGRIGHDAPASETLASGSGWGDTSRCHPSHSTGALAFEAFYDAGGRKTSIAIGTFICGIGAALDRLCSNEQ